MIANVTKILLLFLQVCRKSIGLFIFHRTSDLEMSIIYVVCNNLAKEFNFLIDN